MFMYEKGFAMLTQEAKDLFYQLDFEIQPVALKYCYSQPEGFDRVDEVLSFCQFSKKAAVEDRGFFITVDDAQKERLEALLELSFWEKLPDGRTVLRICTSWATDMRDVDQLIEIL